MSVVALGAGKPSPESAKGQNRLPGAALRRSRAAWLHPSTPPSRSALFAVKDLAAVYRYPYRTVAGLTNVQPLHPASSTASAISGCTQFSELRLSRQALHQKSTIHREPAFSPKERRLARRQVRCLIFPNQPL